MDSLYAKILNCILIWFALSNSLFTTAVADHDYDRSSLSDSQYSYGLGVPTNFYVNKKLSEFLGGPGKRSYENEDFSNYLMSKRLSEFLGGPGRKRFVPSKMVVHKKLSEFLGGPGK